MSRHDRVQLGRGGPRVSRVGLGLWQFGSRLWRGSGLGSDVVSRGVASALELGLNLFDTAEVYGWGRSESMLGDALRSTGLRGEAVVVTKVGGFRSSPGDVVKGVRRSAARLGFEPDVVLHHWPPPLYSGVCGPVRGLERAVSEGLAHYYGLSNYGEGLIEEALSCARRLEPIALQAQYSLAYRAPENRLLHLARERGLGVMAWSPLAKGALAGFKGSPTPAQRGDPVFRAAARDGRLREAIGLVAGRLGVSRAEVALAWVAAKGAVPIVGWRRPERIASAARAASLRLGAEDLELLDRASERYRLLWGREYRPPGISRIRLVPGFLQRVARALMGGI